MDRTTVRDGVKRLKRDSMGIRVERRRAAEVNYSAIHERCVQKYETILDALLAMEDFIEDNIDLFFREDEGRTHRNKYKHSFGLASTRNPTLTYPVEYSPEHLVVFLDKGLHFVYSTSRKKVVSISNNKGLNTQPELFGMETNTAAQYKTYKYFPGLPDNGQLFTNNIHLPTDGYVRFFNPCSTTPCVPMPSSMDEAKKILLELDHDMKLVEETWECLKEAVERIKRVELEYDNELNRLMGWKERAGDGS